MNKRFILTEFPAPCNLRCEYCYINPKDARRNSKEVVTADHYRRLLTKMPDKKDTLFWFCSIGDTLLYHNAFSVIGDLSKDYAIILNSNLSYDRCDKLLDCTKENIAVWWSVHYDELVRMELLRETFDRVKKFHEAGITVWGHFVMSPSHCDKADEIAIMFEKLGVPIILKYHRDFKSGTRPIHIPSDDVMKRFTDGKCVTAQMLEEEMKRWDVKGNHCRSGVDFLAINARFDVHSCGGGGRLKFGKLWDAEGFKPRGTCTSHGCPCSWVLLTGVVDNFPYKMNEIFKSNSGKLAAFLGEKL